MSDYGPVGGGLLTVQSASPCLMATATEHGLADGDRVSIGPPDGATTLAYVKATGFLPKQFALFTDANCTIDQTFAAAAPVAGTPIVKLAGSDYAVVAGINTYPAFSSLQGPVADAIEFQQWLLTEAYVPHDQIALVTSPALEVPGEPPTPTVVEVSRAFEALANKAVIQPLFRLGRRLYIFLSGHGILPTRSGTPNFNETALLMANAGPITLGNHLGAVTYAEWFRVPGVFDEVLLFVDCCRDLKDTVALMPTTMIPLPPQRGPAKNFYAAATQLALPSFERMLGTPLRVRGVFSYALMEALRSQSLYDASGMLTCSLLASQLHSTVPAMQDGQDPQITPIDPTQDIAIVKRTNPSPPNLCVTFSDAALTGKTAQLIGPSYPFPDATYTINGNPWNITLRPFVYNLKVPGCPYPDKPFELTGGEAVQNVQFP
ncbi:MAG: hypothetical protein WAN35_12850 [Terracidiphilus sp.]